MIYIKYVYIYKIYTHIHNICIYIYVHMYTWGYMGKCADYKRNFGDDMGNDIVEFGDLINGTTVVI